MKLINIIGSWFASFVVSIGFLLVFMKPMISVIFFVMCFFGFMILLDIDDFYNGGEEDANRLENV